MRSSVGRYEIAQASLPLGELSLLGIETFRERREVGAEIRTQLEPGAVVSFAGAVEVAPDGRSGKTGIDHGLDLCDADDVLRVVVAVTTAAAFGGEQSSLLVVTQRSGAGPRPAGEFADLHCRLLVSDLTLTLASGRTFPFVTSSRTLQNAYIFHGFGATPDDHWFGWLAQQLDVVDIRTVVPVLPDPLAPDALRWQETVRAAVGEMDERTAMIAHSLGSLAALRHLASLTGPWRLGRLVLVSGFLDRLPVLPELDDFIDAGCDVSTLREHIDQIIVIRSDDDPLVPPSHTNRLADLLRTRPLVVPGAGHFLATDGHSTLPAAHDALTR